MALVRVRNGAAVSGHMNVAQAGVADVGQIDGAAAGAGDLRDGKSVQRLIGGKQMRVQQGLAR